MMGGNLDGVLRDMGNRIVELERLAILSHQRERELRNRTEEFDGPTRPEVSIIDLLTFELCHSHDVLSTYLACSIKPRNDFITPFFCDSELVAIFKTEKIRRFSIKWFSV